MMLLKRFELLPRGLFAADAIRVAKKELQWECDYVREASYAEKFSRYLTNDPVFVVPRVIPELSKTRVFTSEYYDGMVLDDCVNLPQDVRNWVCIDGCHLSNAHLVAEFVRVPFRLEKIFFDFVSLRCSFTTPCRPILTGPISCIVLIFKK